MGTVRSNRLRGAVLKTEKELKQTGRGSADMAVDANSGLAIVRWLDNSAVQLSSTHTAMGPMSTIKRWDRKLKKYSFISCPPIVKECNEFMGGVDLFDMLMSLYKVDHESAKWYGRIFLWALNLAVINGWILYRHSGQRMLPAHDQVDLVKFTASIGEALVKQNKLSVSLTRKRGRPANQQSPMTMSVDEETSNQ